MRHVLLAGLICSVAVLQSAPAHAGGNQPRMRPDRESSAAGRLVFAFDGGTNFDPAVDPHIRSAEIVWVDDDTIDSNWSSHADGKEAGRMMFHLVRSE
jgi:hypothetical protein